MMYDFEIERRGCSPAYNLKIGTAYDEITVMAEIEAKAFEDALDEVADDLSGWMTEHMQRWMEHAADMGEITEDEYCKVMDLLEKVRP